MERKTYYPGHSTLKPVCGECNLSLTNEYPNLFVTSNLMNICWMNIVVYKYSNIEIYSNIDNVDNQEIPWMNVWINLWP